MLDLLNLPRLEKSAIKKFFNRAAKSYDNAAILQKEVLNRLLQRLHYIRHQPTNLVDIGCGTGQAVVGLQKTYPRCKIVCLDLAYSMPAPIRCQVGEVISWPTSTSGPSIMREKARAAFAAST